MDKNIAKEFYSRPEIQQAILKFAKNREIGTRYDGFFGKRPDVIEYISDIRTFVKKGIQSFHISEERWENPLLLENNLTEEEKNKNRIGWDLILDLDGVDFKFAKIAGKIILDFLDELGVKNVSTKFSGNKGFHIGIPFESFSKYFGGYETRELFPDMAKKIALYLMHELKGKISKAILEEEGSIEKIAKKYDLEIEELIIKDPGAHNLNFMKIIEIDTILITTRHLFRAPYSLNEKSALSSIPIQNKRILEFEKKEAKIENVNPEKYKDYEFLKYNPKYGKDADILLLKADETYLEDNDWIEETEKSHKKRMQSKAGKMTTEGDFGDVFEIDETVDIKDFPKTIEFVLNNNFKDGRKRAIFLLLTFLHSINWEKNHIKDMIYEWNDRQEEPLKKNYIQAQISWFESQDKKISPPNFKNTNYYSSIGIPKDIIEADKTYFKNKTVKNPLHYVFLFLKIKPKENKKQK